MGLRQIHRIIFETSVTDDDIKTFLRWALCAEEKKKLSAADKRLCDKLHMILNEWELDEKEDEELDD